MRRFLLGAVVGVLLTIVAIVVFVGVSVKIASSRKPTINSQSVLVLNIEGEMPEVASLEVELPFFQSQSQPTIPEMWVALRAAAADSRIKAIALKPRGLTMGWGKLEELRSDLVQFKKSGKPVYAYLQTPGMHEYYLATVADRIYVSPDDYLMVKGFRVESTYLKGTLDKLGIVFDVDHAGKYKDAGDTLTRTNMSPETREVMNAVLDQVFGSFCKTVAVARHRSVEELRSLIDQGPFLANAALQAKLIDDTGYEGQMYRDLSDRVKNRDLAKISYKQYAKTTGGGSGARIAVLSGEGDIVRGTAETGFTQAHVIASDTFAKTVQQLRKDNSIRGVILRVNSPGGDAVASDEILHELKLLAAEKPLVISMSDVAASGGYFMSLTGDPILAYPNTITGSIGVIFGKPNLHGLYDKIGITKDWLVRGKFAEIDSDYKPLSDAERAKLHEGILATYHSFVSKVAGARRKSYDQVNTLAQGRVWMGAQAGENGLVDRLGGIDAALELLRPKARLSRDAGIELVSYPPRRSVLETLLSSNPDSLAQARVSKLMNQLTGGAVSPSLMRGGILELMPMRISVH